MPDELSPGELGRGLGRLEREHRADVQRLEREHRADIERLERDHAEDLRKLREDVIKPMNDRLEKAEGRPGMTVTRWLAAVTVVLMFLAFVMQTYGTLKGAK